VKEMPVGSPVRASLRKSAGIEREGGGRLLSAVGAATDLSNSARKKGRAL